MKSSISEPPTQTEVPLARHLTPMHHPLTWRRALALTFDQTWAPVTFCVLLDAAAWLGIADLVEWLRGHGADLINATSLSTQLIELAVIAVIFFIVGGYDRRRDMRSLAYTSEHLIAVGAALAAASLLVYSVAAFSQTMRPSRGALLGSFVLFAPVSLVYRRTISGIVMADMAKHFFLVLGAGDIARRFYEAYQGSTNRESLRFIDFQGASTGEPIAGSGSPIIEGGTPSVLDSLGSEYNGVILAERADRFSPQVLERLTRMHFLKVPVYTLESFYETHWRRVPVYNIDPVWPFQVGFQLARNSPYSDIKRLCDIAACGAALLLLSPLLILLGLLIWLDSGKPALFRQTRIGRNNQPFTIYKFRTMHMSKPGTPVDLYTRENDVRITRMGRWLRKLRLDELPQLWNVLKGDMSLIGPRAEWDQCAELYEKAIPFYHFRHLVKPGITGWAQVCYPYGQNAEDALQKLKYDLYYIRHYSLRLDAMIVLKTLHIMFWGKGQ